MVLDSLVEYVHFSQKLISIIRSGARWQDLVLSIHWMLDNHPSDQEQFLWDMAELVHNQVLILI